MMRFLTSLPKKVLISVGVIAAALVIFAIALPLLGGGLDDAEVANTRLQAEIGRVTKAVAQAKVDQLYVSENIERYETLLRSDRLIPHTRRVAILDLENKGRLNGLTAMNYSIGALPGSAAASAAGQPASGAYRVSMEEIKLKVGAPYDGSVYRFIDAINQAFPGAAVIQVVNLSRGITASAGVEGEINVLWRTAQAEEKKP